MTACLVVALRAIKPSEKRLTKKTGRTSGAAMQNGKKKTLSDIQKLTAIGLSETQNIERISTSAEFSQTAYIGLSVQSGDLPADVLATQQKKSENSASNTWAQHGRTLRIILKASSRME